MTKPLPDGSHPRRLRPAAAMIAYLSIAFGFTWTVHGALILWHLPYSLRFGDPAMILYKIGLLGPLIGAVAVSAWSEGRAGVVALLARAARWRFGLRWYLVALGTVPALYLLDLALFHSRIPPGFEWFALPLAPIVGQLWVVLAEEFGWRGFALPRLQYLFGSWGASLALGLIWASWHLPMFFVAGSPQYGGDPLADFAFYAGFMICVTVVFVLLYNRTGGSVLVGMLFHASMNTAAYTIRIPADIDISLGLIVGTAIVAALCLPQPWFGRPAAVPGFDPGPAATGQQSSVPGIPSSTA